MGQFVRVDQQSDRDIRRLFTDLRKLSPEVAKETRTRFKKAAGPALDDAHARQPEKTGELKRKTRVYVNRGIVTIRSSARHGRISEFGGRVRLWGRDQWVPYKARPAIWPAVSANRQKFINEANAAVMTATRKVRS